MSILGGTDSGTFCHARLEFVGAMSIFPAERGSSGIHCVEGHCPMTKPKRISVNLTPGDASPVPATGEGTTGSVGGPSGTPVKAAQPRGLMATARILKPRGDQVILAATFAKEILASVAAGEYERHFGRHAPDPVALAAGLTQAAASSQQEAEDRKSWHASRDTRNRDWHAVLSGPMPTFRSCFELALSQDEALAKRYPTVVVFLRTSHEIATRAAATRKANKSVKPTG